MPLPSRAGHHGGLLRRPRRAAGKRNASPRGRHHGGGAAAAATRRPQRRGAHRLPQGHRPPAAPPPLRPQRDPQHRAGLRGDPPLPTVGERRRGARAGEAPSGAPGGLGGRPGPARRGTAPPRAGRGLRERPGGALAQLVGSAWGQARSAKGEFLLRERLGVCVGVVVCARVRRGQGKTASNRVFSSSDEEKPCRRSDGSAGSRSILAVPWPLGRGKHAGVSASLGGVRDGSRNESAFQNASSFCCCCRSEVAVNTHLETTLAACYL